MKTKTIDVITVARIVKALVYWYERAKAAEQELANNGTPDL